MTTETQRRAAREALLREIYAALMAAPDVQSNEFKEASERLGSFLRGEVVICTNLPTA